MEPQVIEFEPAPYTFLSKHRMLFSVFTAIFWTVSMALWSTPPRPPDIEIYSGWWFLFFVPLLISGLFSGLLAYFLPWQRLEKRIRGTRIRLFVERDQITCSHQTAERMSWRVGATVRKGRVRSIFRIPGGIGVSERSQFGARMLGFVPIRNASPEFEELKSMLESWRAPEANY